MYNKEIILRAPEMEDVELMYRIENSPELWAISNTTVPYSRYVLRQYIETTNNDLFMDKQLRLIIECRESGLPVGIVDLTDFNPLHSRVEVGIVVEESYRKLGVARQTLELLIDYSFRYLHIHQLYAYISVENVACRRLFDSCGFTSGCTMRHWLRTEERYQDVVLVQLISENVTS